MMHRRIIRIQFQRYLKLIQRVPEITRNRDRVATQELTLQ